MAIYVYRKKCSNSATDLADALEARRVRIFNQGMFQRREDGMRFTPHPGDLVVCWGEAIDGIPEGVKVLNGALGGNKFDDATRLREAGVATVEVSRTRPAPQPAVADVLPVLGGSLTRPQAQSLRDRLQAFLATPPTAPQVWVGRRFHHVGGNDLLSPPSSPDYWVKKETLVREFRLHTFGGRSIRAGVKVPREGVATPHTWVRSLDGGWRINYDGFESNHLMRELAVESVKALGLNFGAVDLGERSDGTLLVLECNRAPGLEGNTIDAYASAIRGWMQQSPRQGRREGVGR